MKKVFSILTAVLLVILLAVSAGAQQRLVQLSGTTTQPGHTIFLQVQVTESLAGDTMGITYSYDEELLEPLPDSCSWEKTGILQDFSKSDPSGVWAANKAVDLYGTVCVLAFRVRPGVKPTETEVSCALLVKSGAEEVGKFTAQATVEIICAHAYGSWESSGNLMHKHVCGICGDVQSQMHSWNEGTVKVREDKTTDLMVYTCSVCGGTKQIEVDKQPESTKETQNQPTQSTRPSSTLPTVTRPAQSDGNSDSSQSGDKHGQGSASSTVPSSAPSVPSQGQTGGNQSGQQNTGNDQSSGNQQTVSTVPHDHAGETMPAVTVPHEHAAGTTDPTVETLQDPHAGHDHSHEDAATAVGTDQRLIAAAGIFLVLGLSLMVCMLIVKRKHR